MLDERIAVQLASLRQPLKSALQTASRLGAAGVMLDARHELRPGELSRTGLRQFHKLLGDWNLRVAAVSFPTRRGYDQPEALEERIAATKKAMKLANELGARVVVNRIGTVPDDSTSDRWTMLVDALSDLGSYGDHVGAQLAATTGAEGGAGLASLLAALPQGTLGVDLDPAALLQGGHSPEQVVGQLGQHVAHVHANDAVRDTAYGVRNVELGRGSADLALLIGRLEEFNYPGSFTVECQQSDDPLTDAGNAVAYLKSL